MLTVRDVPSVPPKVLLIGASDQMGCAGLERDAQTLEVLGAHPLRIFSGLTLQDNRRVLHKEAVSLEWFARQLDYYQDVEFSVIKIGALLTLWQMRKLASWLEVLRKRRRSLKVIWDPVLFTSSGLPLIDDEFNKQLTQPFHSRQTLANFLKNIDIVTPNFQETFALLGESEGHNVLTAAWLRERLNYYGLQQLGWLQKGGHDIDVNLDQNKVVDWFVCGNEILILSAPRQSTPWQRGTGCTLASALASFLALGADLGDALVLSKWCVTESLQNGYSVTEYGGPVKAGGFPTKAAALPSVGYFLIDHKKSGAGTYEHSASNLTLTPAATPMSITGDIRNLGKLTHYEFKPLRQHDIGIYPIVDQAVKIAPLLEMGCRTIQLRIKSVDSSRLQDEIALAVEYCRKHDVQLFINDHWKLAIEMGAFGVHLGQSDLCHEALDAIARHKIALGLSSHNHLEIARALSLKPSYLAFGPIYRTTSKKMPWQPQGIHRLKQVVSLASCPVVAIGGIDLGNIESVARCGAKGAAMIGAVEQAESKAQLRALLAKWHFAAI